jgi:hypothetical protein
LYRYITARYVMAIGVVISSLVAHSLLMLLEKDAWNFNATVGL